MSYSCEIHFISDVKKEDMYTYIRNEVDKQKEKFEKIAEENIDMCFWKYEYPETKEDLIKEEYCYLLRWDTAEYLANQCLGLRFIYWKNLELLGIMGDTDSGISIIFQNSTDQNYEFSCYKGIKCISDIVTKYKIMDDESVKKKYQDRFGSQEDIGDIEYYRRSFCYNEIYKFLEINDFIYNKDSFSKNHWMLLVDVLESQEDKNKWHKSYRKAVQDYYEKQQETKEHTKKAVKFSDA